MVSLFYGILFAWLVTGVICLILFLALEMEYKPKTLGILCGVVSAILIGITTYCNQQTSLQWAHGYEAQKSTIELSLQSGALTGFERAQLVQQAAEANTELAKKQYYASRWYGFDMPRYVLELEPVHLD